MDATYSNDPNLMKVVVKAFPILGYTQSGRLHKPYEAEADHPRAIGWKKR